MKTISFLGQQFPIETTKQHYAANAKGLRKMVERSLKTGKYNGFTTAYLIDKAEMYEKMSINLK